MDCVLVADWHGLNTDYMRRTCAAGCGHRHSCGRRRRVDRRRCWRHMFLDQLRNKGQHDYALRCHVSCVCILRTGRSDCRSQACRVRRQQGQLRVTKARRRPQRAPGRQEGGQRWSRPGRPARLQNTTGIERPCLLTVVPVDGVVCLTAPTTSWPQSMLFDKDAMAPAMPSLTP